MNDRYLDTETGAEEYDRKFTEKPPEVTAPRLRLVERQPQEFFAERWDGKNKNSKCRLLATKTPDFICPHCGHRLGLHGSFIQKLVCPGDYITNNPKYYIIPQRDLHKHFYIWELDT